VEFTVCESFVIWTTSELADRLAAAGGSCDGTFNAIRNVWGCRGSVCKVERFLVAEGDSNLERLACFGRGDRASESANSVSMNPTRFSPMARHTQLQEQQSSES
jgi:hypothetical protein